MAHIDNLLLSAGVMKAGTTWLYAQLNQHPEIYFTPEKEIHYLAELYSDFSPLSRSYRYQRMMRYMNRVDPEVVPLKLILAKIRWYSNFMMNVDPIRWYPKLFEQKNEERFCGDFSNLTAFITDEGWAHIKSMTSNLKVLLCLRDPRDRLWSHMKFHAQQTGANIDFSKLSQSELRAHGLQHHLWSNSVYSEIISNMRKNLDDEQLKILFFEEIHSDPEKTLREIEQFIGVSSHNYTDDSLKARVNVSDYQARPKDFDAIFEDVALKEIDELARIGVNFPEIWYKNK